MEESTSYTLQEIEKLKLKISGYRNSLMTLKMGTSLEDLHLMKKEFNELKTQLAYIEGLTKTMEQKQYSQNELYEEQVQQLSLQIATLNKTVEEMGQEIASISNKLVNQKNEATRTNRADEKKSKGIAMPIPTNIPEKAESPVVSDEPSYMQLRNLTKQVIQLQQVEENIAPPEQAQKPHDQKDQRYFNQHYFQSINNQSGNSYQERSNNPLGPTPFHFKNPTKKEDIPTTVSKKIYEATHKKSEPQENNLSTVSESVESSTTLIASESQHDDALIEVQQQSQSESDLLNGELNEHTEPSEDKNKKQKNSSFFNIFRK